MKTLVASTERGTEIGERIRTIRAEYSLADELMRKFIIASVLEPVASKKGCTTRYRDIKDSKRLEFFLTAGINSGFPIRRFVEYLLQRKEAGERTMLGSFRFLTEAVVMSKFNRRGGKINQGILEPIFPLIAAQVLFFEEIRENPSLIFERASFLLANTSWEDVLDLIEAKTVGNKVSGVEDKYPVRNHRVLTVLEYYSYELEIELQEGKETGILHNRQFVDGFRDIQEMLQVMIESKRPRLLQKVEEAYRYVRKKHKGKIGVGLAADHSAVCLYLYISLVDHRECIT